MKRVEKREVLEGVASSHPKRWHKPIWLGQTERLQVRAVSYIYLSALSSCLYTQHALQWVATVAALWQHWTFTWALQEVFAILAQGTSVKSLGIHALWIAHMDQGKRGSLQQSGLLGHSLLAFPWIFTLASTQAYNLSNVPYIVISCAPTILQLMGLGAL